MAHEGLRLLSCVSFCLDHYPSTSVVGRKQPAVWGRLGCQERDEGTSEGQLLLGSSHTCFSLLLLGQDRAHFSVLKTFLEEAGKMAQQLNAPAALAEDRNLGSRRPHH